VEGDVRDGDLLDDVFGEREFDGVIHFAGLKSVGESSTRPLDYYSVNVGGSVTLFQAMDRHAVDTLLFSSSATVYGEPDVLPVPEMAPTRRPATPYGRTKLMVEEVLGDLGHSDPQRKIGVLRYFNPVGAHPSGLIGEDPTDEPNNLMPYIARVASERLPCLPVFGADYDTPDGTGVRDFIHVVDLARGHVAALGYLAARGGLHVWNLGTGRGTSVLEMVAAFERVSGVPVPYEVVDRRPGDVAISFADPAKAETELGWKATLGIERMCADTWRWQQRAVTLD